MVLYRLLLGLSMSVAAGLAEPSMAQQAGKALQEFVVSGADSVARTAVGKDVELIVNAPHQASNNLWRMFVTVPDATETVEIKDLSGNVKQRLSADDLRRGVWTEYFSARDMVFEADPSAEVKVIGWHELATMTQTPVNELNLDEVINRQVDIDLQALIKSVGLLSIQHGDAEDTTPRKVVHCTTFLVAPKIAATAAHCVEYGLEGKFAELVLGYIDPQQPGGSGRFNVTLTHMSRLHDIAFLALDRPAAVSSVFKIATSLPPIGQELLVLQHYGADAMSISDDDDCRLTGTRFNGRLTNTNGQLSRVNDLTVGHGCDTTKSSSGSPVLNRDTYEVVLMHQRGYNDRDDTITAENRGINTEALNSLVAEILEAQDG